ncbi:hypothetical protein DIZ76_017024 [Coccidioides immitis]|uniref:Aminoglycoside phosphotransferase domain-containing protein n=1 Tax=Coccidioides immitis RMSCC 3703 TaxID=454286 RepID=A0A0J8R2V3_COCIT|nr:hypothetical protein CISG_06790 [Coccidioides immitis RMSCC 3703]TPX19237.1 hypothetical protein DIZ76_017024 [Coccidioides immitis]
MPSSCSSCSSRSGTSTVYYGHTAFTEFSGQVRHLCQVLWPQSSPEGTTIERLTGGSYNRVIGLSIDNVNTDAIAPPQAARFILRIPRFESAQVENQIATLSFLKQRTQIPIPKIVLFDLTPENAIDSPYTVQLRISGLDLQTGYQTLSHAQRCSFVRQFARVWLDLQAVIRPIAGHLYIPREDLSAGFPAPLAQIKVSHLRLESRGEASEAIMNTLKTQKPLDMLLFQFRRWSDLHRKSAPNSRIIPNYFT